MSNDNGSAAEALEFRARMREAYRLVQPLTEEEDAARCAYRAAKEARQKAQSDLERLIRQDMTPLPLFDHMPTLEETLEAEADLDDVEQARPGHCDICQAPVSQPGDERCPLCMTAETLGNVVVEESGKVANFWLYTRLDSAGRRSYVGTASGNQLGNWTETDAAEYWPKDGDIEQAVRAARPDLKLTLKDWAIAQDGSMVSLYFEPLRQPEPRKPRKRKAGV